MSLSRKIGGGSLCSRARSHPKTRPIARRSENRNRTAAFDMASRSAKMVRRSDNASPLRPPGRSTDHTSCRGTPARRVCTRRSRRFHSAGLALIPLPSLRTLSGRGGGFRMSRARHRDTAAAARRGRSRTGSLVLGRGIHDLCHLEVGWRARAWNWLRMRGWRYASQSAHVMRCVLDGPEGQGLCRDRCLAGYRPGLRRGAGVGRGARRRLRLAGGARGPPGRLQPEVRRLELRGRGAVLPGRRAPPRPARRAGAERGGARARADRGVHRGAMGPRAGREPQGRIPLRQGGLASAAPDARAHRGGGLHLRDAGHAPGGSVQREQVGPHGLRQVARGGGPRAGRLLRGRAAGERGHRYAEEDLVPAGDPAPRGRGGGPLPRRRGALRDDRQRGGGVRVSLVAELSALLPGATVIPEGERAAPYERDESGLGRYPPQAVVLARHVDDVVAVLKYAREKRLPVVPRGAGTGKSGGALAERGGIVLSLEKLDRILEVSRADMVCVVQPGVVLEKLQHAVEEQGLFYPPDPNSQAMRSEE